MGLGGFILVGHLLIATFLCLSESKVEGVPWNSTRVPRNYDKAYEKYNETEIAELIQLMEELLEEQEEVAANPDYYRSFVGGCGCSSYEISCSCCVGLRVKGKKYQGCLKLTIALEKLQMGLEGRLNRWKLIDYSIKPIVICAFAPLWWPLSSLQLCLEAYDIYIRAFDIYQRHKADFRVCIQLDLVLFVSLYTVDFSCIVLTGTDFRFDKFSKPYSAGVLEIEINTDGTPKASVNDPFINQPAFTSLPSETEMKIKERVKKSVAKLKRLPLNVKTRRKVVKRPQSIFPWSTAMSYFFKK